MASSSRDSFRAFGGDASTGVSLDVMFWMTKSQSHEVAKTHAERGTKKQEKNDTGPGPARARGGLARGAKSQTKLLRPRPRPRRGRRRGGARKSFGAVRARRHVGAARRLGRAAAPQSAQGLARLRRPAASKIHQARESRRWRDAQYLRESWNVCAMRNADARRRQGPHARPPCQKSGLGRRRRGR